MSRRNLNNVLTPGRRRWLEELAFGPAQRGRGPIASQCEALGWTEGFEIPHIPARPGGYLPAHNTLPSPPPRRLERLTAEGRRVLEVAQANDVPGDCACCRKLTRQASDALAMLDVALLVDPARVSQTEIANVLKASRAAREILSR